MATGFQTNK